MKLPLREFFFAATSLLAGGGLRATTLPAAHALVQIEAAPLQPHSKASD